MHPEHPRRRTAAPNSPPTLLDDANVTIYIDGLIFTAFNEERSLFQTAILTKAPGHHLTVTVRLRGEAELLFPKTDADWDPSHTTVKRFAPFFLYVDSGNGLQEDEFSAELHRAKLTDPQSFDHIINLEALHGMDLRLVRDNFAEFNFPHGIAYSADNTAAKLKRVPPHAPPSAAVFVLPLHISTLGAVDIATPKSDEVQRHIVLAGEGRADPFFRIPIEEGKHYEIAVLNEPINPDEHDHENHFLEFYKLFNFSEDLPKFLVELADTEAAAKFLSDPNSPPCVQTGGNLVQGLVLE